MLFKKLKTVITPASIFINCRDNIQNCLINLFTQTILKVTHFQLNGINEVMLPCPMTKEQHANHV